MSVRESASVDDIVEVMNEQEGGESEEGDRETEVKINDVIVRVDNVVKYIHVIFTLTNSHFNEDGL